MDLAQDVYATTKSFPSAEMYGITSQLRRCSVSIPSNIADGRGRRGTGEFIRFLDIAYGSLCELQTQLELSLRLDFVDRSTHDRIQESTNQLGRMLNGLINSMNRRSQNE